MANIVLVHGAWLGGWIWRDVSSRLQAAGHQVYAPTLTGLGERVHLARPGVDLDTHITDVVNVLAYEDLAEAVLVGHSYSGIVVQGAADRAADRLATVVYVDCAPVADGMALFDLFGDEGRAATEKVVDEAGDGWKLPFPPASALGSVASIAGLDDQALGLMEARATPQPIETFRQPLRLTRDFSGQFRRHLIACSEGDFTVQVIKDGIASGSSFFKPIAGPDWTFHEIATGHWPMLSEPAMLASLLREIAGA